MLLFFHPCGGWMFSSVLSHKVPLNEMTLFSSIIILCVAEGVLFFPITPRWQEYWLNVNPSAMVDNSCQGGGEERTVRRVGRGVDLVTAAAFGDSLCDVKRFRIAFVKILNHSHYFKYTLDTSCSHPRVSNVFALVTPYLKIWNPCNPYLGVTIISLIFLLFSVKERERNI